MAGHLSCYCRVGSSITNLTFTSQLLHWYIQACVSKILSVFCWSFFIWGCISFGFVTWLPCDYQGKCSVLSLLHGLADICTSLVLPYWNRLDLFQHSDTPHGSLEKPIVSYSLLLFITPHCLLILKAVIRVTATSTCIKPHWLVALVF